MPTPSSPARSGTYGGRTADERRTERRQRLVEAAAQMWGEQGWNAVSMRGVCSRAGVIDRYFYENFADRDALLAAVWEQVRDELVQRVLTAAAAAPDDPLAALRAVVTAAVTYIDRGPFHARVVMGDIVGNTPLPAARRAVLDTFTTLISQIVRGHLAADDDNALRMSVLMGVGGFVELVSAWKDGLLDVDADTVIEHAIGIGTLLAQRHLVLPP